jgi:hypothetical protein
LSWFGGKRARDATLMGAREDDALVEAKEGHFVMDGSHVHTMTFTVVVFYALASIGIALYSKIKNARMAEQSGDEKSAYFLGGRNFGWFVLFLTIFSTTFNGTLVVWLPMLTAYKGLATVTSCEGAISLHTAQLFHIISKEKERHTGK